MDSRVRGNDIRKKARGNRHQGGGRKKKARDRKCGIMAGKRWTIGFTLVEMLVVVAIVGLLTALTVPNVPGMVRSHKMSAARNLIKSALGQAQAHAAKYQKYAGVRFQFDRDGWEKGQQYLVLIEHAPTYTSPTGTIYSDSQRFVAVANAKPVALSSGIAAISLEVDSFPPPPSSPLRDAYLDDDNSDGYLYCLNGATTFSIIFSPTGQMVVKDVRIHERDANDSIFRSGGLLSYDEHFCPLIGKSTLDHAPWCWAESSALGLYVYVTAAMREVGAGERYSAFIGRHGSSEQVERILINTYMGTIISE